MACVVRVTLHSIFGDTDYEMPRAAQLLKACCDACTAFRTVQKGRQLVRSWIDVSRFSKPMEIKPLLLGNNPSDIPNRWSSTSKQASPSSTSNGQV